MKLANGFSRGERGRMYGKLMVAAGALLIAMTVPASAQTPGPTTRWCTAGFNNQFGWFEDGGYNSALERSGLQPGIAPPVCIFATSADLKANLPSTLALPLAHEVVYDFSAATNPPTVTMVLVEPAICHDYFSKNQPARASGEAVWNLVIKDANGADADGNGSVNAADTAAAMIPWVRGVASLNYDTSNGALAPVMVPAYGTTTPWLRCHSALASNKQPAPPYNDPVGGSEPEGLPFSDGFESPDAPTNAPNLQVAFFDMYNNPLGDFVSLGVGEDIQFKVRVKNIGLQPAGDVWIREFVPIDGNLKELAPSVTRVACKVGSDTGANCSNGGIAPNDGAFKQNVGNLNAGEERMFVLTRRSSSTDVNTDQFMALIQVAAFSDPSSGLDADYTDNSRTLRIRVVDQTIITHDCITNGSAGCTGGNTIQRTTPPSACNPVTVSSATCPPGTQLEYIATAATGYTFLNFGESSGACLGTISNKTDTSGTFTTSASQAGACLVAANFRAMPVVNASVSTEVGEGNGTINPPSQPVHYNAMATLTVAPDSGYEVKSVDGCGVGTVGPAGGNVQTSPLTEDCTVVASFKPKTSVVTATLGANGVLHASSINPAEVTYPSHKVYFWVIPDASHEPQVAETTTCTNVSAPQPLIFGGFMYEVVDVYDDCQVDFIFNLVTHQVTVAPAINGGNIQLVNSSVPEGQNASFTLVPQAGYHYVEGSINASSAQCGTLGGDAAGTGIATDVTASITGSAGPILGAGCELDAAFAINQYAVTVELAPGSSANGGIASAGTPTGGPGPVIVPPVSHGNMAEVWVFPDAGYFTDFSPSLECPFQYITVNGSGAQVYRALSVTGNCNVTVTFAPL